MLDDAHVVGDEQVGQAELALERLQLVEHLGLDRDVEGRDRLVADDQVGLEDQRPGDPDPLPLAARELVRVAPGVVRGEADEVHDPLDLGAALRRRPDAVDPEALADAVADRRPRIERRVRVLEDDLHPLPVRLERLALQRWRCRRRRRRSRPTVGSISRSRSRPTVVLPQPDSPTSPSVSPRRIVKLTPSTAWTLAIVRWRTPPRIGNCLTRSRTSTSGASAGRGRRRGSAGVASGGHGSMLRLVLERLALMDGLLGAEEADRVASTAVPAASP